MAALIPVMNLEGNSKKAIKRDFLTWILGSFFKKNWLLQNEACIIKPLKFICLIKIFDLCFNLVIILVGMNIKIKGNISELDLIKNGFKGLTLHK